MKIAVKEYLIAGDNLPEKLQFAHDLGIEAVEIAASEQLVDEIPKIAKTLQTLNMQISAIHLGHTKLLHPEFTVRDQSIQRIRKFMSYSIDLGAEAVIFFPFYSANPVLPDLHPYKSALELEAELLITQLRTTLCDLAYALGSHLYLQIANSTETHLLRQVSHAEKIRNKLKNHPHLHIAAHTYHMAHENENITTILDDFKEGVQYLYLTDNNRCLPGEGTMDFSEIMNRLNELDYQGWMVLDALPETITDTKTQLQQSLALLQRKSDQEITS